MSGFAGFLNPGDKGDDFSAMSFLINKLIGQLATTAMVKVVAVTNNGALAPVGFVDVTVMVNQVDGAGNPTSHGVIHNLPYVRIQGGRNAIILDPQVDDIGVAVFCSRDISTAKRTKATANPESGRQFDWADGIYILSILGGIPTQYLRVLNNDAGIEIVSPTQITLTASTIQINGADLVAIQSGTQITFNAPVISGTGAVSTSGTMTNNGHDISSTHRHSSSGGTGIGGPPL